MASNWGIGLGSFAGGISRGLETGVRLREIIDQNVKRGAIKEAHGQAAQERAQDAQELVKISEQAGPVQPEPEEGGLSKFVSSMFGGEEGQKQMPKTYSFGGKDYKTMEEAQEKASSTLAPIANYMDKYNEQIQNAIISKTGNAELAEQYGEFANQAKSRRMFASAANAYRKFGAGNYEGGIQDIGDIYKNGDFGVEVIGHRPVNDKEGNLTGFDISMRNTDTGKEFSQTMTPDSLLEFTKTFATPAQMFSHLYQRQASADAAKVELAKEGVKNTWENYKLDKQQAHKLEEITTEGKVKQLYGDGLGGYKRPTAPVEAVRQAVADIMKQSAGYDGKPTLSESEALNQALERTAKVYGMTKEELEKAIRSQRQ